MHILSAVVAAGGSIFMLVVLSPAVARQVPKESLAGLHEAVRTRWQRIVHTCILLFFVSGFYNYLVITAPKHSGQALYHAFFGVKFLLALAVFGLAIVLTGRKTGNMRAERRKFLLTVLVLLALAVVLISGVLKNLPAV